MRIAIDVRSLVEGRHSGVEEYTVQIIRALAGVGEGHAYHLFCNSFHSVQLPPLPGQTHVLRYPNKLFNLAQFLAGWPRWSRLLPADVFFLPHARLLPVARGVPYVVTVHDLSFVRFPNFYSRRRRLWHHLMRLRRVITEATAVVAVSEATRDDLLDVYGLEAERVNVVYSGLGILEPRVLSPAVAAQLPSRYVLYLGTLEPRKNVAGLIEAYSAIAGEVPQDLVLAGSRGWLMAEADRSYARSPVRRRIHRLGFVPEADKAALYAQADLFVYPSFYEGFGFPPLEALACGTPVVVSYNSSLPEVAGEWATLVNPDDTAELALVLRELLLERPVVPEGVQRAVREQYSWDQAGRRTLGIIERAVGR